MFWISVNILISVSEGDVLASDLRIELLCIKSWPQIKISSPRINSIRELEILSRGHKLFC